MRYQSIVACWCQALVLFLLIGCGGGDGGSSAPSSSGGTIAEGRFIDAPVAGITFICGDITGTATWIL
jgi:hypothetical protein